MSPFVTIVLLAPRKLLGPTTSYYYGVSFVWPATSLTSRLLSFQEALPYLSILEIVHLDLPWSMVTCSKLLHKLFDVLHTSRHPRSGQLPMNGTTEFRGYSGHNGQMREHQQPGSTSPKSEWCAIVDAQQALSDVMARCGHHCGSPGWLAATGATQDNGERGSRNLSNDILTYYLILPFLAPFYKGARRVIKQFFFFGSAHLLSLDMAVVCHACFTRLLGPPIFKWCNEGKVVLCCHIVPRTSFFFLFGPSSPRPRLAYVPLIWHLFHLFWTMPVTLTRLRY